MGLLRAAGAIAVPATKVLDARSSETFNAPVPQVSELVKSTMNCSQGHLFAPNLFTTLLPVLLMKSL